MLNAIYSTGYVDKKKREECCWYWFLLYFCSGKYFPLLRFMNKKEVIDEGTLVKNPFTYSLVIPASKLFLSETFREDRDGVFVQQSFVHDRVSSTRVFHSQDVEASLALLSPTAMKLYIFIAYRMKVNQDWIQLNKELFMVKFGVKSEKSVNNAIKELLRYCFITSSHYGSVYWINPSILFCGDRLKKYPNNVEIKSQVTI